MAMKVDLFLNYYLAIILNLIFTLVYVVSEEIQWLLQALDNKIFSARIKMKVKFYMKRAAIIIFFLLFVPATLIIGENGCSVRDRSLKRRVESPLNFAKISLIFSGAFGLAHVFKTLPVLQKNIEAAGLRGVISHEGVIVALSTVLILGAAHQYRAISKNSYRALIVQLLKW